MRYKVGHYYKRTYIDNDWIIFVVVNINRTMNYNNAIIIKSTHNDEPYMGHIFTNFDNATTVELTYIEAVSLAL